MKLAWFFDARWPVRTAVWVSAGAIVLSSTAAMAANDVVLWHSLNPHNKGVFEDLVKDFNKEQDEVRVKLKAFDNENAIEAALAAAKKRDDRPQLVQLDDDRSEERRAGKGCVSTSRARGSPDHKK